MIFETLDTDKQKKIQAYLDLVIEKNKKLNLTRIETREKGMLLHIEDSLSCIDEFTSQDGLFLDIGTGGGFPGVPLAIASGRTGVLIDSVQKKARAVQEMIDELNLSNMIQVRGIRSEELALEVGEKFHTVIARAVSSLPTVLELATPLLVSHGEFIALRGKENERSIEEGNRIAEKLGLEMISSRHLYIGETYERNILVFKKVGKPTIKLPRRNGMAQKKPLT